MPMLRVRQSDYPEIEAEGPTPAETCGRLVRAIGLAAESWTRRPLRLALIETRGINRCCTAGAWAEPRLSGLPSM